MAKMLACAQDPTARVFGIAETAKRGRFKFCGSRLPREIKATPMLAETTFHVAPREKQISMQEMCASSLAEQ